MHEKWHLSSNRAEHCSLTRQRLRTPRKCATRLSTENIGYSNVSSLPLRNDYYHFPTTVAISTQQESLIAPVEITPLQPLLQSREDVSNVFNSSSPGYGSLSCFHHTYAQALTEVTLRGLRGHRDAGQLPNSTWSLSALLLLPVLEQLTEMASWFSPEGYHCTTSLGPDKSLYFHFIWAMGRILEQPQTVGISDYSLWRPKS